MNKLFLSFTLLMSLSVFAQDLIIKKDQTEVKAKVIELTDELIKYNKYELLDGPIYSIKNSEVLMIAYKNGTKEYISQKSRFLAPSILTKAYFFYKFYHKFLMFNIKIIFHFFQTT